ncbi:DUF2510 domain-containing protein [Streptomyces sp. NPDC052236]|uniref:DUF2510 domain-containing protein n=1 Tax=Streptomyces sp. NPDC052236 TaxID=3365686 RepID=UPI0037CD95E4
MSMTTPAGWYPDPSVPGTERWWDGTVWTAHTRPMGSSGRGKGRLVALVTAGVVFVAAVATGVVLLGKDDEADKAPPPVSVSAPQSSPSSPSSPGSPPATAESALLTDQLNGISMPIPEGWVKSDSSLDDGATMVTDGTYDCPGGGSSLCRRGRVSSLTATGTDVTSPVALAKLDIATAADKAYLEDALGARVYGGITSHSVVKSQAVAVAGRAGYLVRWRVITGAGPGGYVQSLAFPSTVGTEALVVVRFAFDAGPQGPGLAEMDRIVASIRPIGDATSGGVGSSIGPGQG